ncbi:MAG: TrkH family potassium uptake protein [Candidatus Paracaedibacteraceae bacterium]|nr:TrkH family potassium uptake protein [Candidatus Paracaedibacteraceae bacterium]
MLLGLLHIIGYLLTLIGGMTLSVAAVSYFFFEEMTQWVAFFLSAALSLFLGGGFILGFKSSTLYNLRTREIFLLTFLAWLFTSVFASLPFVFSNLNLSFTDAFFETVSAITTTGATVLTNVDTYPKTILLWRALLQWFGGIGIVIMAMTVFPTLKVGGMQLFQSEFSDRSEKILPQVSQLARAILQTYIFFTFLCVVILWWVGLSPFDAICHGFTTISTGGLSNYDNSITHFGLPAAEWTIIVFMFLGSIPLITFVKLLHQKYEALFNSQVITYIISVTIVSLILWIWIMVNGHTPALSQGLRDALFTTLSIITTTGFSTADYGLWGSFAAQIILLISIVGACTGSTSGGIKIFRFEILFRIASAQIKTLRSPHGIFHPTYQGKIIDNKVTSSVITFLVLWILTISVIILIGAAADLDSLTAISGAVATISNVGPGIGPVIGPTGSYATLPSIVKWAYVAGMLLGRLEFVTILALASRAFWRT